MDTEKLQEFIKSLFEDDCLKLRRGLGIGLFLYNQLRDIAPSYLLTNLQQFDKMSLEKKKIILSEVNKFISEYLSLRKKESGKIKSRSIQDFLILIDNLKFLEKKEVDILKKLGISCLLDALFYFPLKYEDRRVTENLKLAKSGEKVVLRLRVKDSKRITEGSYSAEVICTDGQEDLRLKFRYKKVDFIPFLYRKGKEILVMGKIKSFKGQRYMVHPKILNSDECGRIFPIYYNRVKGEITKISSTTRQKRIRKAIEKIVTKAVSYLPEYLPEGIVKKYSFPHPSETVKQLHIPVGISVAELNSFKDTYHRRVIYEDLFLFQLALLIKRSETKREQAPRIEVNFKLTSYLEKILGFSLTFAQKRVLKEILSDMEKSSPMNRLLQGDVGSGKTAVAMGAALAAVKAGYQVAFMVPTEVLAHQHYEKFKEFFGKEGIAVGLLTGSLTPARKRSAYKLIKEGCISIVVGTHALIQEKVEFKKLGLVIIDEQHRFGVMQRKLLLEKGKGLHPHCLIMSATPIPRTLALSLYGDLDISIIDEMPPGRKSVRTVIVYESERRRLIELIKKESALGNKIFIVYPLIEESEALDLKSAVEEYEKWKRDLQEEVLLLHGRMSDREKEEIIERFRREVNVLVSTTVIEVGIDVPQATLMIIESAHRFGLSQLHQLRGRVGRSDKPSGCYLVIPDELKKNSEALRRLRILVKTDNGFEIAEMDMKLRGPGELIGISQSGYFGFNVANLARSSDRSILLSAREDALKLLEMDPTLEKFKDLKTLLLHRYGKKLDLGFVA